MRLEHARQHRMLFWTDAREILMEIVADLEAQETGASPRSLSSTSRMSGRLGDSAQAVGLVSVATLCRAMEDTLATFGGRGTTPSAGTLAAVHQVVQRIDEMLQSLSEPSPLEMRALLTRLHAGHRGRSAMAPGFSGEESRLIGRSLIQTISIPAAVAESGDDERDTWALSG